MNAVFSIARYHILSDGNVILYKHELLLGFPLSNGMCVCVSIQGLMFGYATDETEECMPLTVVLAHRLNHRIADLRRSGEFWWARPDSKTQVS